MSRRNLCRYQLTKHAAQLVKSGHPWIFRSHMSTAADNFASGIWLRLVDPQNAVIGYGIFDQEGLIAIRVIKKGATCPGSKEFSARVDVALKRREPLRKYTTAFRAIHGENDSLPGVVIDVYGDTGVLQTYSKGVDPLGRYVAWIVAERLKLKNLLWKLPAKRKGNTDRATRVLRGHCPKSIQVSEGKLKWVVEVGSGQKSGVFLDLRGLRKWLASEKLAGKRVLNLFSYTGTLGLAAEVGGASEIWNVDVAKGALETGKTFHAIDKKKHRYIDADIFDWIRKVPPQEKFDLIIVDPPMMASEMSQVPGALRKYRELYEFALRHLKVRGSIVGCCCTSRISRGKFRTEVSRVLTGPLKLRREFQPEDDHPVSFDEADYLKILIYS